MTNENREMTKDVIVVIVVFCILAASVECIFVSNRIYSLLGLFIGCILAIYMFLYMNMILNRSTDLKEAKAVERYIVKHSVIRYMSVVLVFLILCTTKTADPISCFVGLLGLKVSAYLQPVISKVKKK